MKNRNEDNDRLEYKPRFFYDFFVRVVVHCGLPDPNGLVKKNTRSSTKGTGEILNEE